MSQTSLSPPHGERDRDLVRARASFLAAAVATSAALGVVPSAVAQPGGWRWESPRPQGNTLRSACVDARGALWAAGETGTFGRIGRDLRTWEPIAVRTSDDLLRIACCRDAVVAVGVNGTVVRHDPSGVSESTLGAPARPTLTGVACTGERGVAVTAGTGDLWVAEDGRTMVHRSVPHPAFGISAAGSALLVGGPNGAVSSSPDLGRSWTTRRTGTRGNVLAFARSGSNIVAVGTRGVVLRSPDGGESWEPIPSGIDADLLAVTIARDGETVVVGTANVALSAAQPGRPFREIGPLRGRFHDVLVAGGRMLAVGMGGRVAVRRGRGTFIVAPRWDRSIYATWWDATTRILVGDHGFVARASGHQAPRVVRVPTVGALHAIAGNARGVVLAVGAAATILRSTDRGARWARVAVPATKVLNSVWLDDDGHALTVGERGQRFRSEDGGRTWDGGTSLGRDDHFTGIASAGSTVYVVGARGRLERSDDFGRSWQSQPSPPTVPDLRAVYVTARGTLIVVARPGTVARRDEHGRWSIRHTHDAALISGISGDSERILLVAADGATFVSRDDGVSWVPERPITREVLTSVRVARGRAYATGYWGTLLVR